MTKSGLNIFIHWQCLKILTLILILLEYAYNNLFREIPLISAHQLLKLYVSTNTSLKRIAIAYRLKFELLSVPVFRPKLFLISIQCQYRSVSKIIYFTNAIAGDIFICNVCYLIYNFQFAFSASRIF